MDTRVYLLDGGSTQAREHQIFWKSASSGVVDMPCYSVLIEHADGRFLFDTGFDLAFCERSLGSGVARQTTLQTIPGQLDLLGLRAEQINFVINSHYHFDHCGGNHLCRHATTLCHERELECSRCPPPFDARTYSDRSFDGVIATGSAPEIFTPRFETLRGDQEIARGVHLFETPGHTPGHYSLLVQLAGRRPMLFPSDACYSEFGLQNMTIATSHFDAVASYRSLERLKELAARFDAEMFFPHDAANYPKYLKAPYCYS